MGCVAGCGLRCESDACAAFAVRCARGLTCVYTVRRCTTPPLLQVASQDLSAPRGARSRRVDVSSLPDARACARICGFNCGIACTAAAQCTWTPLSSPFAFPRSDGFAAPTAPQGRDKCIPGCNACSPLRHPAQKWVDAHPVQGQEKTPRTGRPFMACSSACRRAGCQMLACRESDGPNDSTMS